MSISDSARTRLGALQRTARSLGDRLAQLRSGVPIAQEVEAAQRVGLELVSGMDDLMREIEAARAGEQRPATTEAERADFANAITLLANGMVTAQRNLDRASLDYSRGRSRDAAVVPTSFRIPKLTAGFHFSIDRVAQTGIDLLLWHSSKETRERNQQSVSFDIIAVPPSAEFIETIQTGLPRARLLATRAERDAWLGQIRDRALGTMPRDWQDSVLLAEVPRTGDPPDLLDVLAGYTERLPDRNLLRLGAWRITRTVAGMAVDTLVELSDYDAGAGAARAKPEETTAQPPRPPRPAAGTKLLHELLLPWCEAQAAFLAKR